MSDFGGLEGRGEWLVQSRTVIIIIIIIKSVIILPKTYDNLCQLCLQRDIMENF